MSYRGFPIDIPTVNMNVTPHGAYLFDRGVKGTHYGVDLAGPKGTPVYAPEDGVVRAVWRNDTTKPWSGYGPGGLTMLGASGLYHVLGHLDPDLWDYDRAGVDGYLNPPSIGLSVTKGQLLGYTSGLNHVHWEVRRKLTEQTPETRADIVLDPIALINDGEAKPMPRDGGGGGVLLLLLLLALGGKRR